MMIWCSSPVPDLLQILWVFFRRFCYFFQILFKFVPGLSLLLHFPFLLGSLNHGKEDQQAAVGLTHGVIT